MVKVSGLLFFLKIGWGFCLVIMFFSYRVSVLLSLVVMVRVVVYLVLVVWEVLNLC